MRAWQAVAVIAAVGGACAGCGSDAEARAPRDVAVAFEQAVSGGDGAAACALLAPRTQSELVESAEKPCDEAILDEDLPDGGAASEASAYGTMAFVRMESDALFLSEFSGRWKVMAAGCTVTTGSTYECTLQGG